MGQVHFEATADVQKWMQETTKQISKQEELLGKLRSTVTESKRGDEATSKWSGSMDAVTRHVAGFVSLGVAIRTVKDIFVGFDQVAKDAAGSLESVQDAFKRLLQISGGSPGRFADLVSRSKTLSQSEGLDLPTAAGAVFSFESNLLNKADQATIASMSRFVSSQGLSQIAGSLANQRRIFGSEAIGTAEQFGNKLIVAAEPSRADIESLAYTSSLPGLSAKGVNASPDLVMAMTSILSQGAPSPEEGATMVARMQDRFREVPLLRKIALSAPAGTGPLAVADYLATLPDVQQDRLLGAEIRGWRGFQLLKQPENRQQIRDTVARMGEEAALAGTENSLLRRTSQIVEGSPELSMVRSRQRARAVEDISNIRAFGTEEEAQQSILSLARGFVSEEYRAGGGRVGAMAQRAMLSTIDVMETDPRGTRNMILGNVFLGEEGRGGFALEAYQKMVDEMRKVVMQWEAAASRMEQAATRSGGSAARDTVDRGGE